MSLPDLAASDWLRVTRFQFVTCWLGNPCGVEAPDAKLHLRSAPARHSQMTPPRGRTALAVSVSVTRAG